MQDIPSDVIMEPFHAGKPRGDVSRLHFLCSSLHASAPFHDFRYALQEFVDFATFMSEPPFPGQALGPAMARLVEPVPKEAPVARRVPSKKKKEVAADSA